MRDSKDGRGSTRRKAPQTMTTLISWKGGLNIEGGPYHSGTHPRSACFTAARDVRSSRTI